MLKCLKVRYGGFVSSPRGRLCIGENGKAFGRDQCSRALRFFLLFSCVDAFDDVNIASLTPFLLAGQDSAVLSPVL